MTLAPPPPITAFALLAEPSPTDIRRAEGLNTRLATSVGRATMTCYVRADGRLDACAAVDSATSSKYSAALLALQDSYRIDPAQGAPPRRVTVDVAFPKLFDRAARLIAEPSPAEVAAATPPGMTGEVRLACEVTAQGRLDACANASKPESDARLTAAATSLASSYRFQPATLANKPTPTFYTVALWFSIDRNSVHTIKSPDWERRPNGADIAGAYPELAMRSHVSGRAMIRCGVLQTGLLKDCQVFNETPSGFGFGAAGLTLASKFRMRPMTVDGEPVDGGAVSIPVNFSVDKAPPASGFATVKLLEWLPWTRAPTAQEVAAAFPEQARLHGVFGRASLICEPQADGRLTHCEKTGESPPSVGFAQAALHLASAFHADPRAFNGRSPGAYRVAVTVDFSGRSLVAAADRYIRAPEWLRSIDGADLAGAFPAKAAAAGALVGSAVVGCTIASTGFLESCRAESEEPAGLGFGEAGSAVAKLMQANLWTRDGESAVGEKIRLPVHFVSSAPAATPLAKAAQR